MTRITLLVVLFACLASVGATAAAPSRLPPYILGKGYGFAVYTNKHWRAEGIGPVKELEKRARTSNSSDDRSFRIWTPTCKPGQKVTFTRTVDLLGRPSSGTVRVDIGLAVDYFEIFLGNTKVARNSTTIDAKHLKSLRTGPNAIDVVVKLKNTPDACTNFQAPPRRGIWFTFEGTFAADLRVPQLAKPNVYIKSGTGGTRQPVSVTITNLGPAAIPEGTFEMRTSGPGFCVERKPDNSCVDYMFAMVVLPSLSTGGVECTNDPAFQQVSTCTFEGLGPGEKLKVVGGIVFRSDTATPDWVEEDVSLQWSGRIAVGGPNDPASLNNDFSLRFVFCRYGPAEAGCSPKPPA